MPREVRFAERLAGATASAVVHLLVRRRDTRTGAVRRGRRMVAAAAAAGPVVVAVRRTRGAAARAVPPSAAGKLLLAAYVGSGAILEELAWRACLVWPMRRGVRGCLMAGGAYGFAAVHVRRDGPGSAPVHLLNTLAWTACAACGGRMRWPVTSHFLYNWIAITRRPPP